MFLRATLASFSAAFVAATAFAQAPAPVDSGSATISRDQLLAAFDEVSGHVTKAAALVANDKYGYRPAATVRTVGELIGHIVDGYAYYCGRAAGRAVQWSDATAQGPTDKATLAARLQQATAQCRSAHSSGNVGPLIVNYGHTNLHYGNVVTYLRLLGLIPPSSG